MDIKSMLTQETDTTPKQSQSSAPRYSPIHSSPHNPRPPPHSFASPTTAYNHGPYPPNPHSYPQRELYSATTPTGHVPPAPFNRPSASPYPITTAGVSYNAPQGHPSQSPSSASARGHTPHSHRESPLSASSFSHPPPYNHALQSHPSTPLGPPPSLPRSSSYISREPASPYNQQRTPSSTSYNTQSNTPVSGRPPVLVPESPAVYDNISPQAERNGSEYTTQRERERTVSVSPKTMVPSRTQSMDITRASREHDQARVTPPTSMQSILQRSPPQTFSAIPPPPPTRALEHSPQLRRESTPHVPQQNSAATSRRVTPQRSPSTSRTFSGSHQQQQPKTPMASSTAPQLHLQQTASHNVSNTPRLIPRKRKRHDPIPIWAQKANSKGSLIPRTQPQAQPQQQNGTPQREADQVKRTNIEDLEPSFTNSRPYEEITRRLCDALFDLLIDKDAKLSPSEQLEIEAKLGTLIDHDTDQRYYLPIANEAIINSSRRIRFESNMQETHFKNFNRFLNDQTRISVNPQSRRHRIDYTHRRETDTFYDLDQAGFNMVPPLSRSLLNSNVKSNKVRVTRDNKTGEILAKIIKVRLQNIEMTFPNSIFDCRISINIEVDYPGDIEGLVASTEAGRPVSRKKDRLCYVHQACEIDLTQVINQVDGRQTHEAEIELNSNMLRHEFHGVRENIPNRYEDIVRCFMDNIRELARFTQPVPQA
ncbi:mRNA triphosphatase CET1 [Pseudovirgaria hyperparasitica]|uniref:mRNA-capping enzyme subunit beta n=1 Tax=Pseudovirgaria hyperparasitica TaxID=470096 RepID=A0A6A6W2N5_9PEZI|nr:mRNA triphosphatase CET1 [Pseudovirgaria hyperparasitica]KAF2755291.1 mRNA triphosphatase CET1 [Pseudovirgaria hyperparasitica]